MSTRTRRTASEKTEEKEARRTRGGEEADVVRGQDVDAAALGHIPPLLRDPGYSPPANLPREANGILRLQRTLGNAHVQRLVEGPGREKHGDRSHALPAETSEGIEAAHGGGQPLDPQLRTEMEEAFGHDFGSVRVHTGQADHALAEGLGAKAFTTGHDIFFRDGAYDPGSPDGRETLGHELAHVVQQSRANGALAPGLSAPSDVAEIEASLLGGAAARAEGREPLTPVALGDLTAVQRQDAPGAAPAAPAQEGGGAAAPAPRARAAVALAMWRSGVVAPQTRAAELLASPNRGNIATAIELMRSAFNSASELGNTFPGESYPRARVHQYRNAMASAIADLAPHAGTVVPVQQIQADLVAAAGGQAEVEAALQREEIVVPASGGV